MFTVDVSILLPFYDTEKCTHSIIELLYREFNITSPIFFGFFLTKSFVSILLIRFIQSQFFRQLPPCLHPPLGMGPRRLGIRVGHGAREQLHRDPAVELEVIDEGPRN